MDARAQSILGVAGLFPQEPCPGLTRPSQPIHNSQSGVHDTEARELLVQQRLDDPNFKHPAAQKRHLFMTAKQKQKRCTEASWEFNKHEVGKAFDKLVKQSPLPHPGVAQALLQYAGDTRLDELWCHYRDPELEKGMNKMKKQAPVNVSAEMTWLGEACTVHDNADYVDLMCRSKVSQSHLDSAFASALQNDSHATMRVLLWYGAVAYPSKDALRAKIKGQDLELVRLLLSAPGSMDTSTWYACIQPLIVTSELRGGTSHELLSLFFATWKGSHHADTQSLVLAALELQNLKHVAILLAYVQFDDNFRQIRTRAFELAVKVADPQRRYLFLKAFFLAGMPAETPILRKELMEDVCEHRSELVKLLVGASVFADMEPYNALGWAISTMDFAMLELLKDASLSLPASELFSAIPNSTSEANLVRVVNFLGPLKGAMGEPMDRTLISAVENKQSLLTGALLAHGASVEFQAAAAIKQTLKTSDLDTMDMLLRSPCRLAVLSEAIPVVMSIESRTSRRRAMACLIRKGILIDHLNKPLHSVLGEPGEPDVGLVKLLIEAHADVDYQDANGTSCLAVAVSKANMPVLKLICNAQPSKTINESVPLAFKLLRTVPRNEVIKILDLLLDAGATGEPVHRTLLAATTMASSSADAPLDLVRLLLQSGSDANYRHGACFARALESANNRLLQLLCDHCKLASATLERVLPVCIASPAYTLSRLELILFRSEGTAQVLNNTQVTANLGENANRQDMLACLISHGMHSNVHDGILFSQVIDEANVDLLGTIIGGHPTQKTLRAAFSKVIAAQPSPQRFSMIKMLLEAAKQAEIGQSTAMLHETRVAASSGDFAILEVLFQHNAILDTDSVLAAVSSAHVHLVAYLLRNHKLSSDALKEPFGRASRLACNESVRLRIFQELLNAGHRSSLVSQALIDAVARDPSSLEIPNLLLSHGALVDHADGQAVVKAVTAAPRSMALLNLLLCFSPSRQTVDSALVVTTALRLDSGRRHDIYARLLKHGFSVDTVSYALSEAVTSEPNLFEIPQLLLTHGADPGYLNGKVLKKGIEDSSSEVIELLLAHIRDASTSKLACMHATAKMGDMDADRRLLLFKNILAKDVETDEVSNALISSIACNPTNINLPRLLLSKGAQVSHKNCAAMKDAIQVKALNTVEFLISHIKHSKTADAMFSYTEKSNLGSGVRHRVFTWLLATKKVSRKILSPALLRVVDPVPCNNQTVELLLASGADPNKDGAACFVHAVKREAVVAFSSMSRQAKLAVVIPALLGTLTDEEAAIRWLKLCFDTVAMENRTTELPDDVLLQAVSRFGRGTALVQLLHQHGASALAQVKTPSGEHWSLLLWILLSKDAGVSNEVALKLIELAGKDAGLFKASDSGVSALFACLFDPSRTPVLRALLTSNSTLAYTTKPLSPASFNRLAKCPAALGEIVKAKSLQVTPLMASIILGNLPGLRLLSEVGDRKLDDGSLHVAALLARPDAVELLLSCGHKADYQSPMFDYAVPLAMACQSDRNLLPGDDDTANWRSRLQSTMQLLGAKMDTTWRSHEGKTVLHFALDKGVEVTQAIVEVLKIRDDPNRNDIYEYVDKEMAQMIHYSPTEYVKHFVSPAMGRSTEALARCLRSQDLKPRYYRDVDPIVGEQPAGYTGLPADLQALWDEHEADMKREAYKQQKEDEEQARRNALEDAKRDRETRLQEERQRREKREKEEAMELEMRQNRNELKLREEAADQKHREAERTNAQFLNHERQKRQELMAYKRDTAAEAQKTRRQEMEDQVTRGKNALEHAKSLKQLEMAYETALRQLPQSMPSGSVQRRQIEFPGYEIDEVMSDAD